MKTKSVWASTEEVVAVLRIGRTNLMQLKRSNELIAGEHWVYISGKKHSPIGWDLEKVRNWQRDKAQKITNAPLEAVAEFEFYQRMGE